MCGRATLAMVVSSTVMIVASITETVIMPRLTAGASAPAVVTLTPRASPAAQRAVQRRHRIPRVALGHVGGLDEHEGMWRAGIDVHLGRHAGADQPARIVHVLLEEEIEGAAAEVGWRQA